MNHGRLDLLPPVYGARARIRLANRRIIFSAMGVAVLLLVLVFHARVRRAGAEDQLSIARTLAEKVIAAENLESQLIQEIEESRIRIEEWRRVALPLPIGRVLITMSNAIPEAVLLDRLQIDVTGIRTGSRRERSIDKRLLCQFEGMAPDEQTVRLLVEQLRDREPFEEVRRGFTALDETGPTLKTRFSVSFEIDLTKPSCVVMGGDSE
ncbi:MAG: hypothetical protein CBC35_06495 [Planctomycetes bacterium TMED75]|nr:hypothetical protein [Planctomycetaceae bacterium]OUU92951.1 MAG: hypothetical protein CBC35_06495 [Planctomycetes bacterium TMED75]